MRNLRDLQRQADLRRDAAERGGQVVTECVREYKRNPTVANYKRIVTAVRSVPKDVP